MQFSVWSAAARSSSVSGSAQPRAIGGFHGCPIHLPPNGLNHLHVVAVSVTHWSYAQRLGGSAAARSAVGWERRFANERGATRDAVMPWVARRATSRTSSPHTL